MGRRKPKTESAPATEESTESGINQDTAPKPDAAPEAPVFPVVGIGASAGGLAAFEAFFSAIPKTEATGMAFVLVQHLAPDHKSLLSELVRRYTSMEVTEVADGVKIAPDRVYIIPPNRDMALMNGALHLLEPDWPRGTRGPIDFFFRSLAQDRHEGAVCVVLSGSGCDGAAGVREIKAAGGLVLVQTPESAEHDGMPRSAIATGMADWVLPPAEMPARLAAFASQAYWARPPAEVDVRSEGALKKICLLLRAQTGHDFSDYKKNTLLRRIERRMALHRIDRIDLYLRFLKGNRTEVDGLFGDLLIGVTGFFRDHEAFALLKDEIKTKLLPGKSASEPLRIWSCGCSTGEEPYSLAILIQEMLGADQHAVKTQIFATDIDGRAIDKARNGVYPAGIAADVSPERLERFFVKDGESGNYRVNKSIRDLVVFSEQNVLRDPPFSRIDLIVCRNLMIYLNGGLQKKTDSPFPLFAASGRHLVPRHFGNDRRIRKPLRSLGPAFENLSPQGRHSGRDAPGIGGLHCKGLAVVAAPPPRRGGHHTRSGGFSLAYRACAAQPLRRRRLVAQWPRGHTSYFWPHRPLPRTGAGRGGDERAGDGPRGVAARTDFGPASGREHQGARRLPAGQGQDQRRL